LKNLDKFRGRSSGVEHNLAKVGVVGSNPIARSIFKKGLRFIKRGPFCFSALIFSANHNLEMVGEAGSFLLPYFENDLDLPVKERFKNIEPELVNMLRAR
jgi:hypothetical protein